MLIAKEGCEFDLAINITSWPITAGKVQEVFVPARKLII
jgi:hypothetical protein